MSLVQLKLMRPSRAHKAKYRRGASPDEIIALGLQELERFRIQGQVEADLMLKVVEEFAEMMRDLLFEECPSWVDDPRARWHGTRGLSDD